MRRKGARPVRTGVAGKDPHHWQLAGGLPVFKAGVRTPGHRAWTRAGEAMKYRTFHGVLLTMPADLRKRRVT